MNAFGVHVGGTPRGCFHRFVVFTNDPAELQWFVYESADTLIAQLISIVVAYVLTV